MELQILLLFSEKESEVTNSRGDFTPHASRPRETLQKFRESHFVDVAKPDNQPATEATARCDEELGVGDRCEDRAELWSGDSLKARLFFAPREK